MTGKRTSAAIVANGTRSSGWYPDPSGPPGQERWWDATNDRWEQFTRPSQSRGLDSWLLFAAAGCLAMLVGPFAPWATALAGVVSRNGVSNGASDGWIIFCMGVAASLLVYRAYSGRLHEIWLVLTAVVGAIVAAADIVDISGRGFGVSVGWGLILCVAGSLVVLAAAVVGRRS